MILLICYVLYNQLEIVEITGLGIALMPEIDRGVCKSNTENSGANLLNF